MRRFIFVAIIVYYGLIFPANSFAASIPEGVREGNRLYDEKKYAEAVKKYNEAKEESPDSDIVNFNLGAAQYKNGSYGEAVDSFTKALNTDDHEIEAKAIYNIANAKYRLGSQNADTDINSAVSLYRESLEYYKRAMDLDESAKDARYNHELVERELKVLLEKQQSQQQQQGQDRKDQDGQDREKQDKDQAKKDAGDGQEPQEQPESDKDEQAEQQKQESEGKSPGQKQEEDKSLAQDSAPDQEGSSEEKAEKMSPEEARMLLESYREDEARDNEAKRGRGYYPGVVKNW